MTASSLERPVPAGRRGLLITFEGPEGSGKSTLIRAVAGELGRHGEQPLVIREPGGTGIGERIRDILLDPASEGMSRETELLLMVASRAQLVREKIAPALAAGMIILCDRFADASVAYQGHGRELGEPLVRSLNRVALGDLEPDLTFLCMLKPDAGLARLHDRVTDRLDREPPAFHAKVYRGYQAMADSGEMRFKVIDATASPAEMLSATLGHLKELEHGLLRYL